MIKNLQMRRLSQWALKVIPNVLIRGGREYCRGQSVRQRETFEDTAKILDLKLRKRP